MLVVHMELYVIMVGTIETHLWSVRNWDSLATVRRIMPTPYVVESHRLHSKQLSCVIQPCQLSSLDSLV